MKKEFQVNSPEYGAVKFEYWLASDCLIVSGRGNIICPQRSKEHSLLFSKAITDLAEENGKKKIVALEFYCDESPSHHPEEHVKLFENEIRKNKNVDEFLWMKDALTQQSHVRSMIQDFCIPIGCFADAVAAQVWMPHLVGVAERISKLNWKVMRDAELLQQYTVAAKVLSLQYHPTSFPQCELLGEGFDELFGDEVSDIVSPANIVALFKEDGSGGVLVTKSLAVSFSVPRGFNTKEDFIKWVREGHKKTHYKYSQGSYRILLEKGGVELSLYLEPGAWAVSPHPELELNDKYIHFVPMWQRLYLVEKK